jgi:hypothetical protein
VHGDVRGEEGVGRGDLVEEAAGALQESARGVDVVAGEVVKEGLDEGEDGGCVCVCVCV